MFLPGALVFFMRYLVYIRKSSTEEDKQCLSVESQRDEMMKLIERHKISDYEFFVEEMSASKPGRPVFGKVIDRVAKNGPFGIVCWRLDRLARNPIDGGAILWALQERRISEIITPTNTFTPETNVVILHVEFGMAHQFIRDLTAGIRRGVEKKLSLGWYPAQAPLGYRNFGVDKGFKEIAIDEHTIKFVKKVFQLMASGNHSMGTLVKEMNDEYCNLKYTSLKWKAYQDRKGKRRKIMVFEKFHTSRLERIIRNPFYYGYFLYKGKMYKGVHQPIVSKFLWDRANEMLNSPYQNKAHQKKLQFAYRGKKLIRCGECGCSITAELHIKPSGKKFPYYRCTKAKGYCSQPYLGEKLLESQLGLIFDAFQLTEEEAVKIQEAIEKLKDEDIEYMKRKRGTMAIRLEKLEKEKSALFRKTATSEISEEDAVEYEKIKQEILSEVSKVKQQLKELDSENPEWYQESSNLIKLATEAKKLFFAGNPEQKQKLLRKAASNLTLKDKTLHWDYRKSISVLVKRSEYSEMSG